MNVFLQVGVGLSIALFMVWGIMIKRKAFGVKALAGVLTFTALCGGVLVYGAVEQGGSPEKGTAMSAKQMITFCNTLLAEEQYDEVLDMVRRYSEAYGYDEECSYIVAKTKALEGNYDEAVGIYKRLAENKKYTKLVKEELELVSAIATVDPSYKTMTNFLLAHKMEPAEYGYTEAYIEAMEEASELKHEDIEELIVDNIKDQYDVKEYDDYLELAEDVASLYERYVGSGAYRLNDEEQEELDDLAKELKEVSEEHAELLHVPVLQKARNKFAFLQEDYRGLVESVDANSGYEELLIAAELYMSGIVKEKHFPKEFTEGYGESFEAVASQLETVIDELEENEDVTHLELEEMEALKDSIEEAEEEEVLYVMKERLNNKAEEAGASVSEIGLMLSKIEHYCENYSLSQDHFTEAVVTGKNSKNDKYAEAMRRIEYIINSKETQEIVNVGTYINQAIESSLPYDSYSVISNNASQIETDEEKTSDKFSQMLGNYVSQMKSSIAIGQIETSDFETVRASVVISSEYAKDSDELEEILSVYDCGIEIKDFEIEKIEYKSLKTMLICDVSGSMDNCIGDLKNAVNTYVGNLNKNERAAIVTFSSGIRSRMDFTTDVDKLTEFSNSMYASGGTEIYNTLYRCLGDFEATLDCNDTIILMTDGQDGSPRSAETILQEIGALVSDKGIAVYTVGLGDVDTNYLSVIAESGNGEFVYVADSESLASFYAMLQGQVNNQYILTYKAENTLLANNRTLEVKIENENIFDKKSYDLAMTDSGSGSGTNPDEDIEQDDSMSLENNPFVDSLEDSFGTMNSGKGTEDTALEAGTLNVYGLDIRAAYQTSQNITAYLKGTGFTKNAATTMKFVSKTKEGGLDIKQEVDIAMKYVDETTYKVIIPASLACGVYDIDVSVGGKTAYMKSAFMLLSDGSVKTTTFGPYSFTSTNIRRNGNKIILTGNVIMNGWLHFKNGITLEGDLEHDGHILVTDRDGSYVSFDKNTAVGLSKHFAEKGINFSMPALGEFRLYNDRNSRFDFDSYQVDSIRTGSLVIMDLMRLDAPVIHLYPDSIKLDYVKGSSELPFQDVIFTSTKKADNPFDFDISGSAVITEKQIGIVFEFEGENNSENYRAFNMFNAPVYLNLNELKVSVNTIKHEYAFGGMVKIGFLDFGVGADITLKGFVPDSFLVTIDKDKSVMIGQVPVTFSEAGLGAENIATAVQNKQFGNVTLVGQLDVAVAKVSAYFPSLKKYVGDMSIASIDDATFKFCWNPFELSATADMLLFDNITVAKASFEMGNYKYTNELLGLDAVDVAGMTASLTAGIMWDIDKCKVNLANTGTLNGNSRFIGIESEGKAEFNIEWWLFDKQFEKTGKVLLGVYFTEDGDPQFTLMISYDNLFGKNKKWYYYIDKNGNAYNVKNGKSKKIF